MLHVFVHVLFSLSLEKLLRCTAPSLEPNVFIPNDFPGGRSYVDVLIDLLMLPKCQWVYVLFV